MKNTQKWKRIWCEKIR